MFVVMALITTVSTTPLTRLVYPLSYQQKAEKYRRGEIDWDGNPTGSGATSQRESFDKLNQTQIRRLLVYLRLDSLPGLFTFISILGNIDEAHSKVAIDDEKKAQTEVAPRRHLQVHGIRLLELTERTSSVMQVTEVDEFARHDPVVNTFRTFSQLNDVAVTGQVAVEPAASFPETLVSEATEMASDFVLIPWGERGLVSDDSSALFTLNSSTSRFDDRAHLDFLHGALDKAVCNTGIFIDNGFGTIAAATRLERPGLKRTLSLLSTRSHREPATLPVANKTHRIFLPFFGGVDDRVALRCVLQLAKNKNISLTVARFGAGSDVVEGSLSPEAVGASLDASVSADVSMTKAKMTAVEDEPSAHDLGLLSMLQSSLPSELSDRVTFVEYSAGGSVSALLDEVVVRAGQVVGQAPRNGGDIVVLGRRHARFGAASLTAAESSSSYDLSRTIGAAGARVVNAGLKASVLVIQAGGGGLEW